MEQKDSLLGVLKTLFKWKKYIIYTCGAVALGSIIICLLMKNYYKAEAIFYPANPYISSAKNIFGGYDDELYYFGGTNEIEQMLTIANSSALANYMVKEFGLYEHYGIDSNKVKAAFKVREKFYSLFDLKKNERDAINISMEDRDPEFAAQLLSGALIKINSLYKEVISGNRKSLLSTYEIDLNRRETELVIITDSLAFLRKKYGIYDVQSVSESLPAMMLSTQTELAFKRGKLEKLKESRGVKRDSIVYLAASVQALEYKLESLTSSESGSILNIISFNEGIEKVRRTERLQRQRVATFQSIREKYEQLKTAFESEVSSVVIIEPVSVPEVKSRPRRSIIVASACLIAFIFSIIGVLLFDQYKHVNWREIVNAS